MDFSEQQVKKRKSVGMIGKKNVGFLKVDAKKADVKEMRKSMEMDSPKRSNISDSGSNCESNECSDSWDEFERSVDEETERMLNQGGSFSPHDFANLLNSGTAHHQVRTRYKISHYVVIGLVILLILTVTNALLKEHGYYVRCPGSGECASCYGPFWGKSWCPNPDPDYK